MDLYSQTIPSVAECGQYTRLSEDEWHSHANYLSPKDFGLDDESDFDHLSVSQYWKVVLVLSTRNPNGRDFMFPNLSKCISSLLPSTYRLVMYSRKEYLAS